MTSVADLKAKRDSRIGASVDDDAEELPKYLSPKRLSEYIDVSVPSLAKWRKTWPNGDRVGPPFSTPPGTNMVRYVRAEVDRWMKESGI